MKLYVLVEWDRASNASVVLGVFDNLDKAEEFVDSAKCDRWIVGCELNSYSLPSFVY